MILNMNELSLILDINEFLDVSTNSSTNSHMSFNRGGSIDFNSIGSHQHSSQADIQ